MRKRKCTRVGSRTSILSGRSTRKPREKSGGRFYKCDATNQLKKHCSPKPINVKFGGYVYHVSSL